MTAQRSKDGGGAVATTAGGAGASARHFREDGASAPATGCGPRPGSAWLSVVGIGEEGLAGLGTAARAALDGAETLIGGHRHLAMVPPDGRERLEWPRPFDALAGELRARRGRPVCVLATGDPFCYGVGTAIARHFPREEMRVYPSPSAFSLACARLGWSLPAVETLSLHGRPLAAFRAAIRPGARVLALSHDGATPARIAELLDEAGYGESRLTVLERMGGTQERVRETSARTFALRDVHDFNTVAVECAAAPGAALLARVPGLPDDAFEHDGQLTRRVPRAAALAALAPCPGQLLWDVGAGCGSVGIEWMRAAPAARAIAIERRAARRALIACNAERLGTPGLHVVAGEAPAALAGLDAPPDAVFVGGGLASPGLFDACWAALPAGGRLVAHAVSVEGEGVLLAAHAALGGEVSRIAVSRAAPLGRYRAFRPAYPVTELAVRKR